MATSNQFPLLTSPLKLGQLELKNRLVFGPHLTGLDPEGYVAYLAARARNGVGMIVLGATSVHETSRVGDAPHLITEADVERLAFIVEGLRQYETRVLVQLGHLGYNSTVFRSDGSRGVVWGPSAGHPTFPPNNAVAREMQHAMIEEVIESFGTASALAKTAGLDGVEIAACHDSLPVTFLSRNSNHRQDRYGGSFENRLRFLREALQAVREAVGESYTVGLRISAEDCDNMGLERDESVRACEALDRDDLIDYLHITNGAEGSRRGFLKIIAPMTEAEGFTAEYSAPVKSRVSVPVVVTGRMNQPQTAERVLAEGAADAIGMVRPLIVDPEFSLKVAENRSEDIRACIACNQACIGHTMIGAPVGCIQNPETGRELKYPKRQASTTRRRVLVVGGGPGGMQAAALAAERGHDVILCEADRQLGGQVRLAQSLPGRTEFGGIITNFQRELERASVDVRLNTRVDRTVVEEFAPDVVIVATGGKPAMPALELTDGADICTAWDVLRGDAKPGNRVVVADYLADWVGPGIAEMLAQAGHSVRLATLQSRAGEGMPPFHGDEAAGRLFTLGVDVIPYARLYGADEDTVYFEHIMALQPIICEGVDTLVLCFGQLAEDSLAQELEELDFETHRIGDCLTPRTAEEAILEGYKVAATL